MKILSLFFILFPLLSFSLPVSQQSFFYKLLDDQSFYTLGSFLGKGEINLIYARFGSKRGEKGSLVFLNGRDEHIFKYVELFYDLIQEGYSPIYVYDHRDQGFSDRLPSEENSGYVEDFRDYTEDLETFLQEVVLPDSLVHRDSVFAISHSMGGTILMDYLQTTKNSVFKSVVFSSPMFRIATTAFEDMLLCVTSFLCWFGTCEQPHDSSFKKNYSLLTDSPERVEFLKFMREEKYPEFKTGPPSLRWLVESSAMSYQLLKTHRIQRIENPFLIIQSEKDEVVSKDHQDRLCSQAKECCQLKRLEGKHESFVETDDVRDEAIFETLRFFSETDQHQSACSRARNKKEEPFEYQN